jgi:hypothetical protein
VGLSFHRLLRVAVALLVWARVGQGAGPPTIEAFEEAFGRDTVRGEQLGPASVKPLFSFESIAIRLKPELSHTNGIDPQWQPGNRNIFNVPAFLILEEDLDAVFKLDKEYRTLVREMRVNQDGDMYYRVFVHPRNKKLVSQLLKSDYEMDPITWWGTPTSSTRTLFLLPDSKGARPIKAKLGLPGIVNAGNDRSIGEDQVEKSVETTQLIREIHTETKGKLPDGTPWTFEPEVYGAVLEENGAAGFSVRLPAVGLRHPEKYAVLPFLELTTERDGEPSWIDRLFEASGEKDKKEWLWKKVLKPVLDLHILLDMDNGLTTELHGQNALLVVDPKKMTIKAIAFKDTEAMMRDISYRSRVLGKNEGRLTEVAGPGTSEQYIHWHTRAAYTVHMDSVIETARRALSPGDAAAVVAQSERLLIEDFNRRFPKFAISSLFDLDSAWLEAHRSFTPQMKAPPEEKTLLARISPLFEKEDTLEKIIAGRKAELWRWMVSAPFGTFCDYFRLLKRK